MQETWLNSNRRVLKLAMIPIGLVGLLGMTIYLVDFLSIPKHIGTVFMVLAALLLVGLFKQLKQARISFGDGKVLFFLKAGDPIAVPVEAVEAFFLGQGPANLR